MATEAQARFEEANMEAIWESNRLLNDQGENVCEGCWHCRFPGIRWPASPDGCDDLSYVDRCDYCERYESDEVAAKFLAQEFSVRWGFAFRTSNPKTDEDLRYAPPENDGLNYTGWSCFIDRPERDA